MRFFLLAFMGLCQTVVVAQQPDSTEQKNLDLEVSFGQSLTFISYSKLVDLRNEEAVVVPTSNLLFFAQLFPERRFRVPLFFLVPTETKQFLVNGQIINERSSPTLGTGVDYRLFRIPLDKQTNIDIEAGPIASLLLDRHRKVRFAPVAAARIRIVRSKSTIMYLGTSYSIGINAWGLFYGTGFLF